MIIIDTNSLIVLIIGLIDENLISKHKRTSIYSKEDFYELLNLIGDFKNLLVLPNIWTEVDNLLNNFQGNQKRDYIFKIREIISNSTEKYLETKFGLESQYFERLGLTDSLILEFAKDCKFIITSDSKLSDYANANGISVYDMIQRRNEDFK
jgi:rRNA-processing protein FCF1